MRTIGFRHDANVGGGNDIMQIFVTFGGPELPGDVWDLQTLDIDYGIEEDPVDQRLAFGLYWADPLNSQLSTDHEDVFLWLGHLSYRVLTSVGVIQAIEQANVNFSEVKAYEGSTFGSENLFLGITSSIANVLCVLGGTLVFEQTLIQRQLRDDRSEYEADFLFEETLDEEENQEIQE